MEDKRLSSERLYCQITRLGRTTRIAPIYHPKSNQSVAIVLYCATAADPTT
jgi:hypothetical protein